MMDLVCLYCRNVGFPVTCIQSLAEKASTTSFYIDESEVFFFFLDKDDGDREKQQQQLSFRNAAKWLQQKNLR